MTGTSSSNSLIEFAQMHRINTLKGRQNPNYSHILLGAYGDTFTRATPTSREDLGRFMTIIPGVKIGV